MDWRGRGISSSLRLERRRSSSFARGFRICCFGSRGGVIEGVGCGWVEVFIIARGPGWSLLARLFFFFTF